MTKVAIILIHGTWPHGILRAFIRRLTNKFDQWRPPPPIWSSCRGKFAQQLSREVDADVLVQSFEWSGFNAIGARRKAAKQLAENIDAHYARGVENVFLVAHSHGGNVAVSASMLSKKPIAGLIAMATPFISASRRLPPPEVEGLYLVLKALLFLVSCFILVGSIFLLPLLVIGFFLEMTSYPHWPTFLQKAMENVGPGLLMLSLFALTIIVAKAMPRIGIIRRPRIWHKMWCRYLARQKLRGPCLVIRASGDEATVALMMGEIISAIQEISIRLAAIIVEWGLIRPQTLFRKYFRLIALLWTILTVGNVMMGVNWAPLEKIMATFAILLSHYFHNQNLLPVLYFSLPTFVLIALFALITLVSVVASVTASVVYALSSAPLGLRLVLFAPWVELHVEAGPTDVDFQSWIFSKNAMRDDQYRYRHGVYENPETPIQIGKWIGAVLNNQISE